MTTRTRRTVWAASALAAMLALSACAGGAGDPANEEPANGGDRNLPIGDELSTTADAELAALVPEDIRGNGVIQIALDIPFQPMAMYDDDGREIGFDPELARLLGQKLDIDVSLNKQAFDSVIPSLQAGRNDIIMAGMNDTPERQETLTFVNYTYGGFGIAVQKGNPPGIGGVDDLCGKTVAIQKASYQGELLRAQDCGVNITELPSDLDAQTALRAGKSDAYVADAVVAEYVVQTTEDGNAFEIIRDPENPAGFNPVYSGIGILKEDTELIEAIRAALQSLIDEGVYQQVLDRHSIGAYAVDEALTNQGAEG